MTKTTFISKLKSFFVGAGSVVVVMIAIIAFTNLKGEDDCDKHEKYSIVANERVVLTDKMVIRELKDIGEFSTLKYEYSGITSIENTKKFLNLNIPLTKHSIDIAYEGIIKAGIRMDDVEVAVDNKTKEIIVNIPKAVILDNYIDLDTLISHENNNILNPIQASELSDYLVEVEKSELENAIEEGIYNLAEKNARKAINELLEPFEDEGYSIEFDKKVNAKNEKPVKNEKTVKNEKDEKEISIW